MFVEKRRQAVMALLNTNRAVSVRELAEATQASDVTIRRDLAALAAEGRLSRRRGGAVVGDGAIHESTYGEKETVAPAEKRAIGWIMLASLIGYAGSNYGTQLLGPELGVLIGALALGIFANLYARVLDRPQQVVLVPAVILLVPGSMGFRGMSSLLDRNTMTGIETTFATFVVAMAIVAGLLIANALVSPRRSL